MLATDEIVRKAITTTTNLNALIPQLWAAQIERNLRKREVLQQSVVMNTDLLVPGAGNTVYIPILPDMQQVDALTEGTDMVPYALNNATSIPLTPTEYGMTIEASRKALDRIKYDGVAEIIDRLSYSMSLRIEGQLAALWNATVPGTSTKIATLYANGKTSANITATDTFNDAMIWNAIAQLQAANNVPFDDGYYRLYMNPTQWASLMQDQNVRQDLRFAEPDRLLNGEVGVMHGCRLIVTNYIVQTAEGASNGVTVNNAMLLAPRWAAMAWKRRPGVVVDPTLYDLGRRRRFGILADYDAQLIHAERALILKSA